MKDKVVLNKLRQKMVEISEIPPQQVGIFTDWYKRCIPYVKYAPWRIFGISSLVISVFLYILLGTVLVYIASILQYGY